MNLQIQPQEGVNLVIIYQAVGTLASTKEENRSFTQNPWLKTIFTEKQGRAADNSSFRIF